MSNSMCVSCDAKFDKTAARLGLTCPVCKGMTVRQILTGVVNNYNVSQLEDEIADNAINLSYKAFQDEHESQCADEDCIADDHYPAYEDWESDSSDELLVGDWKYDEARNEWDIDRDGTNGWAAVVRESVSQVVWSRDVVKVKSMCSPCYPMQADLDSGAGEIPCYAFPFEMMEQED